MKIHKTRLGALGALVASLALLTSACGGSSANGGSGGSGGSGGDISVTFLPKNLGNPYFDTSDKGGKTAVEEFGGTFKEVGPDAGQPRRAGAVHQHRCPAGHQGARRVSANDPKAIGDALNQAREAGTKVVTFDSDTDPQCRDLFINQATAEGIAKVQVDMISEADRRLRRDRDPVRRGQRDQPERLDQTDEEGPGRQPPEHQARRHRLRQRRRPDVVRQDGGAAAVAPEPQGHHLARPPSASPRRPATSPTSDYKGKVALTGLGTPNQMRDYVKDGTVKAFALWNPEDLGYLAAYAAKALVDGDITGEEGDTFKAGKLGEYKVGADDTVLLGDPFVFNKSNIDKFNF